MFAIAVRQSKKGRKNGIKYVRLQPDHKNREAVGFMLCIGMMIYGFGGFLTSYADNI
jgi:hypothetical protein